MKAIFPSGINEITTEPVTQWDYGQTLEFEGDLPALFEVHFSHKGLKEAIVRSCSTPSSVIIPDICIEQTSTIIAWVYEVSETSGKTVATVYIPVTPRARPEAAGDVPVEISDKYTESIAKINELIGSIETTHAGSADYAEKAKRDNNNNVIDETYATKDELENGKLKVYWSEFATEAERAQYDANGNPFPIFYLTKTKAQETYLTKTEAESTYLAKDNAEEIYAKTEDLENGYILVQRAENAIVADSADSAKKDFNNNIIHDTYLTKTEAESTYLAKDGTANAAVSANQDGKGNIIHETYLTNNLAESTYVTQESLTETHYTQDEMNANFARITGAPSTSGLTALYGNGELICIDFSDVVKEAEGNYFDYIGQTIIHKVPMSPFGVGTAHMAYLYELTGDRYCCAKATLSSDSNATAILGKWRLIAPVNPGGITPYWLAQKINS